MTTPTSLGTWKFMLQAEEELTNHEVPEQRTAHPGRVKCVFGDNTCIVLLDDGTEALCHNTVFPGLQPGYPVIAYPDGARHWSLHDPSWTFREQTPWTIASLIDDIAASAGKLPVRDQVLEAFRHALSECWPNDTLAEDVPLTAEQKQQLLPVVQKYLKPAQRRYLKRFHESYCCGDLVPFRVTHGSPTNPDQLHGTVLGEPAIASRRCLAHPRCLPVYPISMLTSEPTLQWHLVDPRSRPLKVSRNLNRTLEYFTPRGEPHPHPGLFLLALDALAKKFSPLPAVVCLVTREFVSVDIYGVRLAVYPEQCHWERDVKASSLFRIGQAIEAHVIVDLEAFTIDTSLLPIDGMAWRLVTSRFPIGATVHEAKFVVENRNGFVVDLPCPGLQVRGQVPFGELAEGNDPFSSYIGERDRPLNLKVIRHDVQRRRLILSWRQALPSNLGRTDHLHAGYLIPAEIVLSLPGCVWARWAPGQLVEIAGQDLPRSGHYWARVLEPGPQPRLELLMGGETFTVSRVDHDFFHARTATGQDMTFFRLVPFANVRPGQQIHALVCDINHTFIGPRIIASSPNLPAEKLPTQEKMLLSGTVVKKARSGYWVDLGDNIPGFLPDNEVELRRSQDAASLIGKLLKLAVVEVVAKRGLVVVTRSGYVEAIREEKKRRILGESEEGQVRSGIIKNIADFGIFVDLGGLDGLIHISDIVWGRPPDPRTIPGIQPGKEIQVYVLSVDRDKERIALSLKHLTRDPWKDVEERYAIHSVHTGKVTNVMNYGAFVELEPGVEGLVHISEMSWTRRLNHPSEAVGIGDRIEVKILSINKEKQEIGLSRKQTQKNPWDEVADRYPPNTIVTGTVRNLTNYGAFIEIEPGVDGLLHVSDMSWTRKVSHPSEVVKKGETATCIVLGVDQERKRIGLGLKQMNSDPWEGDIPGRYHAGQILAGKVTKLTNFGVFVELEPGLEGLLHISELAEHKVESPEDVVKVGDDVQVKILRVEAADRKIGLSKKRVTWTAEQEAEAARLAAIEEEAARLAAEAKALETPAEPEPAPPIEDFDGTAQRISTAQSSLEHPAPPIWSPDEQAERGPRSELDLAVEAWLNGMSTASAILPRLREANLAALASLVEAVDDSSSTESWTHPPRWVVLTGLLELGYGTGKPLAPTAHTIDTLLRLAAGNPAELFVFEALAEVLPPGFVVRRHDELRKWLDRDEIAIEQTLGLDLLRMRALRRLGQLEDSYLILNHLVHVIRDTGMLAERKRLVEEFREELQKKPSFDHYDRDFTKPPREGSFAMVIPVRKRGTDQVFALKHALLKEATPDQREQSLELFTRETEFLRQVDHPNVIALEEVLRRGCIVLEWFPGRPLRTDETSVGQPGSPWNVERVLDLGYRVASALHATTRVLGAQFVHNDLHPGNVMIDPAMYDQGGAWVKVIDFGLSTRREFESLSAIADEVEMRLKGEYRAPEMARGIFIAPATDLFALASILFHLLTGQLPRIKPDDSPQLTLPVQSLFEVPGLPTSSAELFIQMLAYDPGNRPDDWAMVREELARHLAGRPLEA